MKRVVIGITGEMSAGKTCASEFLVSRFKVRRLTMSTILNHILGLLDLPLERQNQQKLGFLLRENFGNEVLAHAFFPSIEKAGEKILIVDGIRKVEEIKELKKFKNFRLIFLKADLKIRYDRMKKRGEKSGESAQSFDAFKISHHQDSELDISNFEQYSDFVIENNGSVEEFENNLTKVFMQIIS